MIEPIMFGLAFAVVYSLAEPMIRLRMYLSERFGWTLFECVPCSFFWISPMVFAYSFLPMVFLFPFYMAAILLVWDYWKGGTL